MINDKSIFEIVDLYDVRLKEYEAYCKEYEHEQKYSKDKDDLDYLETPEECKERLLGDLARGEELILVKYSGHDEIVSVPDGVTALDPYVFSKKTFLREVHLPDTVKWIGRNAFDGCTALENVRLGKNLTVIGWDAFARCKSLKTVVLPERVVDIDLNAFYDSGLEEIFIPKNIKELSSSAFLLCEKLKKIEVDQDNPYYYSRDNCVYLTKNKWLVVGRNDGTLPDDGSFTNIMGDAFAYNPLVTEVKIPSGVTCVDTSAFNSCLNLRRVSFPDTLQSIGRCAFEGCTSLEEVVIPGSVKIIEGLSFFRSGVKKVVIKRGVEVIDEHAFYKCPNLREIYIPSTIKRAQSPIELSSDTDAPPVRVYIETDDEKNYESWLHNFDGFDIVLGCKSEIFD